MATVTEKKTGTKSLNKQTPENKKENSSAPKGVYKPKAKLNVHLKSNKK